MSKGKPERRPSPLSGPGGKGIDPSVQAVQQRTARLVHGRETKAYKVILPRALAEAIHAEATALTRHQRRGWSDLVTALLQYAWKAYQDEEVEIELQAVATRHRIVLAKE